MTLNVSAVDKIAQQFSHAAQQYQQHDVLQRITAQVLQEAMGSTSRLLDIGCGPGTDFSFLGPIKQVLAVDIAPGMLQQMRTRYPEYLSVCGDAQCLPLQDNSVDAIYSNLALQWCATLNSAVQEMARVLSPKGECYLAIVVDGSLQQLKQLGLRVNRFQSAKEILASFNHEQWQLREQQVMPITVHFNHLKPLLYSIKGVGASVRGEGDTGQAQPLLRGRQDWLALNSQAEQMRQKAGLPLTYQILFIRAKLKG